MSVDNTKLVFYSEWEIDQLVSSATENTLAVSTGTTQLVAVPAGVTLPEFLVQLRVGDYWFNPGTNSTDATSFNIFFYAYIKSGYLYINTNTAGTARWFFWSDRFDN